MYCFKSGADLNNPDTPLELKVSDTSDKVSKPLLSFLKHYSMVIKGIRRTGKETRVYRKHFQEVSDFAISRMNT